ncbi:MAG TPA: hypothetical protein VM055_01120 [Novosphingobium sp.]|nr:hypothetical protein [Novosphingobium sp.]
MRVVLQILGLLLILSGGLWALQGAGLVMWPAESFMLAQRQWVLYGLITVGIGAALLWWARRRPA